MTEHPKDSSKGRAAAYEKGKAPGPKNSDVQVRNSGSEATRDDKKKWDEVDEAADETFPASDSTAKY